MCRHQSVLGGVHLEPPGKVDLLANRLVLRGGISETPAVDSMITPDSSNEAEGHPEALGYFAVPSAYLCVTPHRQRRRFLPRRWTLSTIGHAAWQCLEFSF